MKLIIRKIISRVLNKYIAFSFGSAILLAILCYFTNNLPVFTGESLDQLFVNQVLLEKLGFSEDINTKNVVFYNVGNDQQLIHTYNSDGNKIVKSIAVTDREKLIKILKLIKASENYKYVILDLMFCKDDKTKFDDELFSLISNIDRIVFVRNDSIEIACKNIIDKSAIAEYYSTITATNFTRYEYMRGDERYLPLKVFEDLYPQKSFKRYGWKYFSIYTSNGALCRNSIFLTFDSNSFNNRILINSLIERHAYYNIGEDVLQQIDNSIPNLSESKMIENLKIRHKDKYLIIGNFASDVHDTYAGTKPGSLILLRAIQSLDEGKHLVHLSTELLLFIFYFLISLFICTGRSILLYIPYIRDTKYKIIHYFADTISFTAVFFLVEVLEYALYHTTYSLIIPILYFHIVKGIFHYIKYEL